MSGRHCKKPELPVWLLFGSAGAVYYVSASSGEEARELVEQLHKDTVKSVMRAHLPHHELKPMR